MPLPRQELARSFAQLQSESASGALRYTSDGLPTRVPAAANASEQLMQQMNAEAVARGNATPFPSAGEIPPSRLEAREFVPIPAPAPRVSLPELADIPPGVARIPPSSSAGLEGGTGIGGEGALAGRVSLGANAGVDLGLRLAGGQNLGEAALGTGLSLGGALAGAEAGAALGTLFFPGVGTAIGGAVGGVIGGLGGSLLANKLSDFFHPHRSSNLPDYLEPRGQGGAPILYPPGTTFVVTWFTPGRNDGPLYIRDVRGAYSVQEDPKIPVSQFQRWFYYLNTAEGPILATQPFVYGPPQVSIYPLINGQPGPQLGPVSKGDTPSIPANQPYVQPEPLTPSPRPKPRGTPAPQQAPQAEPTPQLQPAPERVPSRVPSPLPASKPIPTPADATQPTPVPSIQPASTPGQAGGSLSSENQPLKARSLNPERFPDYSQQPQNNNEPLRSPSLNPDRFPDPTSSKQPDPQSPTSPAKTPSPTIDPKAQPKPDPEPETAPANDRQCKDPCIAEMQAQQDKNKPVEIKVKVFKACKTADSSGSGSSSSTTNSAMDDDLATYEEKTIKVPAQEADNYKLLYAQLAKIEALQCKTSNAIASVPEWWQLRAEAGRPQFVIIFAEVFSSGKLGNSRWSLTIPHYNKPQGLKPTVPSYEKGSCQGVLTLTDNSKLIVNAKTTTECKRMINSLKLLIPASYRTMNRKGIKPKVSELPDAGFKECRVTPIRGDFYKTGARNLQPDWSIDFKPKP